MRLTRICLTRNIHDRLEEQRAKTGKVRAIILKGDDVSYHAKSGLSAAIKLGSLSQGQLTGL